MGYLTSIRKAFQNLQAAYDVVQRERKKDMALKLIDTAILDATRAKQELMGDTGAKAEDYLYAEWRKYAELANLGMGDTSPQSLANRAVCDQLQYLLQDWSPYGHKLVWGHSDRTKR